MRKQIIRPNQQRSGGPVQSLEIILGIDKKAVGNTTGNSDFAGISGVTGTFVVGIAKPGDIVFPGTVLDVVTPVAVAAATLTAAVGITGTVDRFIAATSVKDTTAKTLVNTTATHALPYVNNTASDVNILVTLVAATGNISDITAGELRVRIPISRKADRIDSQG